MRQVHGVLKNGYIELDEQPDWPQGERVLVKLLPGQEIQSPNRSPSFDAALAEVNERYGEALRRLAEGPEGS